MPICKLNHMPAALSPGQRLLGLDVGRRRSGLPFPMPLSVASPLKILWRKKFTPDAESMFALADAEQVGA